MNQFTNHQTSGDDFKLRAVAMATTHTANSVARELGCDHTQIDRWAKQLGVTIMKMNRKLWSDDEVKIVRRLAGKKSVDEIALKLGRSKNSVLFKMVALGISTAVQSRRMSRADLDFICDNWSKMSCRQIADHIGRKYQTVYTVARRIGLF